MTNQTWRKNTGLIFATLAGSHLYGTNTSESDIDIRGVCFSPKEALLGLSGFEQYQPGKKEALAYSKSEFGLFSSEFSVFANLVSDDVTIYALNKFFMLLLNANPNIIELLFAPRQSIIYSTDDWDVISKNRVLFLSTKIIHTFSGYAYSQLKRIEGHKRWLDQPPAKPDPMQFGMVQRTDGGSDWESRNQHNAYKSLLKDYTAYQTWRKNRNPKRATLEEKHGYDTKHAAHLYRLVDEAEELLDTGKLTLPLRPEIRDRFMAVLNGQIDYEDVVRLGREAKDRLLAKEAGSVLPKKPNRKMAERLLVEMQLRQLAGCIS